MEESILNSVKLVCNVGVDNTDFDQSLIIFVNAVLATLLQLGVGPKEGFAITGSDETWSDLLGEADTKYLNHVQTYVGLKTRLLFDPPVSSAVKDSITNVATEMEWRLNVAAENHQLEEEKSDNKKEVSTDAGNDDQ